MVLFSTKEAAEASELSVRQIQNLTEKNVVRAQRLKSGRGFSFQFDSDDLIRFMLIFEMMKFGIGYEKMYWLIINYFTSIRKKADVTKYIEEKLHLKNKHFHLVCEYPTTGEHEEVYGYLIYNPDDPFPSCYLNQPENDNQPPGFYGYKFEDHSNSALFINMGGIYKKHHEYLLKHPRYAELGLLFKVDNKSKMKGQ